jgi:hypothetical protein
VVRLRRQLCLHPSGRRHEWAANRSQSMTVILKAPASAKRYDQEGRQWPDEKAGDCSLAGWLVVVRFIGERPTLWSNEAKDKRACLRRKAGEASGTSPPAKTSWRETISPPSASSLLSYGGFNETGPLGDQIVLQRGGRSVGHRNPRPSGDRPQGPRELQEPGIAYIRKAGSGHNDFTPMPSRADAGRDDNGVEVVVRWPGLT